ncbi:MAG: hypothetical protein WC100_09565 [Sterolibacterium sp.]
MIRETDDPGNWAFEAVDFRITQAGILPAFFRHLSFCYELSHELDLE